MSSVREWVRELWEVLQWRYFRDQSRCAVFSKNKIAQMFALSCIATSQDSISRWSKMERPLDYSGGRSPLNKQCGVVDPCLCRKLGELAFLSGTRITPLRSWRKASHRRSKSGGTGGTRTRTHRFRKPRLYPFKLPPHTCSAQRTIQKILRTFAHTGHRNYPKTPQVTT